MIFLHELTRAIMAQLLLRPLLFSLYCLLGSTTAFRAELRRIDSDTNLSNSELLHRAVVRSRNRASALKARLQASAANFGGPVHILPSKSEYVLDFSIGTPPQKYSAVADTGSDLIWIQCKPCLNCFPQLAPYYDPSKSSTYTAQRPPCPVGSSNTTTGQCFYHVVYGSDEVTEGLVGKETFIFDHPITKKKAKVPGVLFGCSYNSTGDYTIFSSVSTGIFGLSKGHFSLPSQLAVPQFSYCLTRFGSRKASPLLFGSSAALKGPSLSTPFAPNPLATLDYYYLTLKGISVGKKRLPIPSSLFVAKPDGNSGFVIDSGSTVTSLKDAAFEALRKELTAQLKLPAAPPTQDVSVCYFARHDVYRSAPKLVFHFEGADMSLGGDKYLNSTTPGTVCLMILSTDGISILGNFQQTNMHVLYDLKRGVLSFQPAQCDKLV